MQRDTGIFGALLGWVLVGFGLVLSATAAGVLLRGGAQPQLLALEGLSFGIAVAGLGTAKTGIAFVLWGILRRIWSRVASAKAALPDLVVPAEGPDRVASGVARTRWGTVTVTPEAPRPLFIHRMARAMWAPMLLMGVMALYFGLALAILQSRQSAANPELAGSLRAWVQGVQFLGEGLLLSAISFFLGTILGAIRSGGGEVQQSLRVPVKTLQMPFTAKLFVGLMMAGLMIEIAQFLLYARVASMTDAGTILIWSTWLGPFREFGLGVLLSGAGPGHDCEGARLPVLSHPRVDRDRALGAEEGIEMAVASAPFRTDFNVVVGERALRPTLPQRIGRVLWGPMLAMALMAFPLAFDLALARAALIGQGDQPAMVAALGHYVPAAMFLGFASVFAAISFAVARILGVLRAGGGSIQEAAGRTVQTLKMPFTAYAFIGLMMMAMMLLLFSVAAHVVVAKQAFMVTAAGDPAGIAMVETMAVWLEALRRLGAVTYLVSIALGLATIFRVLGFQAIRIRELAFEPRRIQ